MKTIGQAMTEMRNQTGLSRRELSVLSGVSIRNIDEYESGKVFPGILNLICLADTIGVSVDRYIGHEVIVEMMVRVADPSVRKLVKQNGGYCPCAVTKTPDTKCMCKDFREQNVPGTCHCGLYEKVVKE